MPMLAFPFATSAITTLTTLAFPLASSRGRAVTTDLHQAHPKGGNDEGAADLRCVGGLSLQGIGFVGCFEADDGHRRSPFVRCEG